MAGETAAQRLDAARDDLLIEVVRHLFAAQVWVRPQESALGQAAAVFERALVVREMEKRGRELAVRGDTRAAKEPPTGGVGE